MRVSTGCVAVLLLPVVLLAQQAQSPPRPETDEGILSRLDESTKTLKQAVERVEEKVDDLSTRVSTMEGEFNFAAGAVVLGVAIVVGLLGFFQVRTNRLREREQKLREDEQELRENGQKFLKGMLEDVKTVVEQGPEPQAKRLEKISRGVETLVKRGAQPQAREHTAPE